MGIYSETMSNTPVDTTFEEDISIDVFADPLKKFIDNIHYMNEIFESKGYGSVNIEHIQLNGEWETAIRMDYPYVNRFCKNMNQFGYSCTVVPGHKRRYRYVIVNGEHPFELFHVFRHLEVFQ